MSRDRPTHSLQSAIDDLSNALRAATEADALQAVGDRPSAATVLDHLYSLDRELAGEAFLRLVSRLQINPESIDNPGGYLSRLIRNMRTDESRRTRREILTGQDFERLAADDSEDHRETRRLLASAVVLAALREAAAMGEHKLVEFAAVWLDTADELGRTPTSREMADVLDVSHQTVINRLNDLERYIER